MTSHAAPPRPAGASRPAPEGAVSTVIGAVLMFALLVTTLVVVQTTFVPVWEEDREAGHMDTVAAQFAALASDLDRQGANHTDTSIAGSITLQRTSGARFFGDARQPADLEFIPNAAGTGLRISSPRITVQQSGSQVFYGLAEPDDWIALDNVDDTISGITELRALRVRVDVSDRRVYDHGDSATLTISDRTGQYAGRAVVTYIDVGGSERAIRTQVYTRTGAEVASDIESFFHNTDQGNIYVDLMDPSLLWDAIFGAVDKPATLTMTRAGLRSDYVIVYDQEGGGQAGTSTTVGNVGLTVAPYRPPPFPAGSVVFTSRNQHFVDQRYIMEHGAVVREQDDGAVFVVPPRFRAGTAGTQTVVDWAIPSLAGGRSAVAGPHHASVLMGPGPDATDLRATAGALTFEIPTRHPALWWAEMDRTLRTAGLDAASGHYFVTMGDASVTVELRGTDPDPARDDLFLVLQQTDILIDLRGT